MLRALLLSLISLALAAMATAQTNLVLNGSFEDTVFCTTSTQCTLLKAEHWYNPNTATPDVWDCDLDRLCGSAMQPTGPNAPYFQLSQEGVRHAGIYLMLTPNGSSRDYLMTKLTLPMLAGSAYEVSLWQVRKRWRYAIDHIGVWFGQDSLFDATPNWLSVTPQIRLRHPESPYLLEGFVWEQLADTFVAAGGEQWMVIGNFDPLGAVDYIDLSPDGSPVSYAYHFIDQVAVEPIDEETGIASPQLNAAWQRDELWLQWPAEIHAEQLKLFDARGRLVHAERLAPSGQTHRVAWRPGSNGVYLVLLTGDGVRLSARVAVMGE